MSTDELYKQFEEESEVVPDQLTVAQLDEKIRDYRTAREEYEAAKKVASDLNAIAEAKEAEIMGILEKLGKKSYEAEGVGRVSKVMKTSYKIPTTGDAKAKLFSYIQDKYGKETLVKMLGIHHNTLNSWANQEILLVPSIPGLEAPTSMEYIMFTKKEK